MYDFYFGSQEHIDSDPAQWLLTIKRMLPRWPNGIPDSEFLAVYDLLAGLEQSMDKDRLGSTVLVETGSGASTIVLLYFALRWNTELFTWDISSNKLAYLRGMLTDTLFKHFQEKNIFSHWKYMSTDSKCPHTGISILGELGKKVSLCFLDSEHTWANLGSEVSMLCPQMADGGIVAIDDANYRYKNCNTAYINMLRTKAGLAPTVIEDNECRPFWEETEELLKNHFGTVTNLEGGTYRETFKDDIFWQYNDGDRKNMSELDMEKMDELAQRFEAWKVSHE